MFEFVNEGVSVELVPRPGGKARLRAFVWRGCRYIIESWGRESDRRLGNRPVHCHLFQTAGGETWELCQDIETAQWTLRRHWGRGARAV